MWRAGIDALTTCSQGSATSSFTPCSGMMTIV